MAMVLKRPRVLQIRPETLNSALLSAVQALEDGQLVVLPTETVYGVGANPAVAGAAQRLADAKGRDRDKPIALLAASLDDVRRMGAELSSRALRLADAFWPGPLTLVLRVGDSFEGFRIPAHAVALELLRRSGGILRVSSANLSGEPPALTAQDAIDALGESVVVVLDAGPSEVGEASTVVRVAGDEIEMLREGAIPYDALAG